MALPRDPSHLRALVDIGSNGIRLSITSLHPSQARILPTLHQCRCGISLYDAQYPPSSGGERQPIPPSTIASVIAALRDFKRTTLDFGVPASQVKLLATEATRTAINSADFIAEVRAKLGWEISLLSKEEEGRIGALGVASSLPGVRGLVMDLGGGSVQLSWLDGQKAPKKGAVSMPYGAAALMRRLGDGLMGELEKEVSAGVKGAYESLEVEGEVAKEREVNGGVTLFLSGGGFRGWGYVLMSRHRVQPYPISVINGFRASREQFLDTEDVQAAAAAALENESEGIFRVSDRRAGQVPAVAFLVKTLAECLPAVKEVRFCQGGVREGYLSGLLSAEVRALSPLVVATTPFVWGDGTEHLADLLGSALPPASANGGHASIGMAFVDKNLITAFANMMYTHSSHSKDLQASAALRSTTSGVLASVHGLLHESRALLGLLLCARWGDSVSPTDDTFKRSLQALVEGPWTLWWVQYLGAVAALIGTVWPAGWKQQAGERLTFAASWETDKKGNAVLRVIVTLGKDIDAEVLGQEIHGLEKVGKRKRWIGGRDGVGCKVAAEALNILTRDTLRHHLDVANVEEDVDSAIRDYARSA
ncbi:retrograde regulation protein 2 [Oleoguttula sp. CCFEE 5521]